MHVFTFSVTLAGSRFCYIKCCCQRSKGTKGTTTLMLGPGISEMRRFLCSVCGHDIIHPGRNLRISGVVFQDYWTITSLDNKNQVGPGLVRPSPTVACLDLSDSDDLKYISPESLTALSDVVKYPKMHAVSLCTR